jgi:hypothetical protein
MSGTYTASLPVSEDTVLFVSALLHAERRRLATRAGTRSLGCYRQAILVLRWLLDGTRIIQLAIDNQVSRSTGYAYLHEGLTVIAEQAPPRHPVPADGRCARPRRLPASSPAWRSSNLGSSRARGGGRIRVRNHSTWMRSAVSAASRDRRRSTGTRGADGRLHPRFIEQIRSTCRKLGT